MPVLRNNRHEKVLHNFIKGMRGGAAWTAAGYSATGNAAEVLFSRMMRRPEVKERYAELMAPAIKEVGLTVERVLNEFMRLAFYDVTAIIDTQNGRITIKDPTSLPEDLRRAIVSIKPVQIGDDHSYEIKFGDKLKALDSLSRHLQMFKDMVVVENVFRVVNEMEDDELDRRLAELERAYEDAKTLDPSSREDSESIH